MVRDCCFVSFLAFLLKVFLFWFSSIFTDRDEVRIVVWVSLSASAGVSSESGLKLGLMLMIVFRSYVILVSDK